MFKKKQGIWKRKQLIFKLDTNNITSQIASEEQFVEASELKKDPNAVYIEFAPKEALEKLTMLSQNPNYQEK